MALRASRLLENTLEQRKEKYVLIKKAYTITSLAVHRGVINTKKMKDIHILDKVAEVARQVILLKIENRKEFNWKDIELS